MTPARRALPLRTYFAGLVALFVVFAALGVVYVHNQTAQESRHAALRDAAFAADEATALIDKGVTQIQPALTSAASDPGISELFADPSKCVLSWAAVGAFTSGHFDFLRPDGSIVCSSRGKSVQSVPGYAGQSWLANALVKPTALAPVHDPLTGQAAALLAEPVTGGALVAFIDLAPIGPDLATQFGGPRHLQFVTTSRDRKTIIASSEDPKRWVGASLGGTAFASSTGLDRRGLTGRDELFSGTTSRTLGWRVYAGADAAATFSFVGGLYHRELGIIAIALLVVLAMALFIYRRIARPVGTLAAAMRASAQGDPVGLSAFSAPAEIANLSDEFARLTAAAAEELAQRRQAEEMATAVADEARAAAETYRMLFAANPQPMWIYEPTTMAIFEVNDAATARYGYSRDEFLALTIADLRPPEDLHLLLENMAGGEAVLDRSGPWVHRAKDGTLIRVEITSHPVFFQGRAGRLVLASDVTERERLQLQLAQSQRLESLGQLAGGVAHDFNNLLAAIINYSVFVREEIDKDAEAGSASPGRWDQARADMDQIEKAAERAARLTHQLLAFARQEIVQPKVITINDVVQEIEPLLRRTLGEHIDLSCALDPDLWHTIADHSQLEQVLVNLAVNARDAMPGGGRLTVETENTVIDEVYATGTPDVTPGQYVRLRVSDTGIGMDAATIQHAFEPFFTTKAKGEGTGLGLATIYGIVTQAGGHVKIYSEPGVGTTVTALLPATQQAVEAQSTTVGDGHRTATGDTVLVVEDEDAIREVARRLLSRHGYHVMTASTGADAIEVANAHPGPIALLMTDVIMPQMLGKEVAEHITAARPDTRVLFMSGYAGAVLGDNIAAGAVLLEKPFSEEALLTKLDEAFLSGSRGIR